MPVYRDGRGAMDPGEMGSQNALFPSLYLAPQLSTPRHHNPAGGHELQLQSMLECLKGCSSWESGILGRPTHDDHWLASLYSPETGETCGAGL